MIIKANIYGMAAKYVIPSFKLSAACWSAPDSRTALHIEH